MKDSYIDFLKNYFDIYKPKNIDDHFESDLSYRVKTSFSFSYVMINELPFVIAELRNNSFSISEFNYVRKFIKNNSKNYALFYFDKLIKQNIMSLTKYGLGYIVGTHQFYIPELSILINELHSIKPLKRMDSLSLGTQNILFKILLLKRDEVLVKELNDMIKEPEYAVYRAVKELENKKIIEIKKYSNHRVVILYDKESIWERAKPLLESPIMEELYVDKSSIFNHIKSFDLIPSGQYALSQRGMIVYDEKIYAIENKQYKEIKSLLKQSFKEHNGAIKLQVWKSRIIRDKNNEMNLFALYLSLIDDYDERVKMDYENLISEYWR